MTRVASWLCSRTMARTHMYYLWSRNANTEHQNNIPQTSLIQYLSISERFKTKYHWLWLHTTSTSFRNNILTMLPSIGPKRHHPSANLRAPCRTPVGHQRTVRRNPKPPFFRARSLEVPFHPCWCPIPAELTLAKKSFLGITKNNIFVKGKIWKCCLNFCSSTSWSEMAEEEIRPYCWGDNGASWSFSKAFLHVFFLGAWAGWGHRFPRPKKPWKSNQPVYHHPILEPPFLKWWQWLLGYIYRYTKTIRKRWTWSILFLQIAPDEKTMSELR